ncbi:hypothetical protein PR048_032539 [Dryococelus australis]|uniref:Uncharacterized protein n=1 Tax=Dryococelus australis TaxID=614101 RepID=A0ABQ9G2G8_9NEOP|nr:hypothetical protein PR048_032539 [Dryococelus australis]
MEQEDDDGNECEETRSSGGSGGGVETTWAAARSTSVEEGSQLEVLRRKVVLTCHLTSQPILTPLSQTRLLWEAYVCPRRDTGLRTPEIVDPQAGGNKAAVPTIGPSSNHESLRVEDTSPGREAVSRLTSHHGEPSSNPGPCQFRFFRTWRTCRMMLLVKDLPFPPRLHSGAAPCSPLSTLIGWQDLGVKSRALFTVVPATHLDTGVQSGVVKRGECRAAPERKGGRNGDPRENPMNQRHRAARFPRVKARQCYPAGKRDWFALLGGRRSIRYAYHGPTTMWLDCSPPNNAKRFLFPEVSLPYFRMWESCRTMPLVAGFSRGYLPFLPPFHSGVAPYSRRFTLIGSQDLSQVANICCLEHKLACAKHTSTSHQGDLCEFESRVWLVENVADVASKQQLSLGFSSQICRRRFEPRTSRIPADLETEDVSDRANLSQPRVLSESNNMPTESTPARRLATNARGHVVNTLSPPVRHEVLRTGCQTRRRPHMASDDSFRTDVSCIHQLRGKRFAAYAGNMVLLANMSETKEQRTACVCTQLRRRTMPILHEAFFATVTRNLSFLRQLRAKKCGLPASAANPSRWKDAGRTVNRPNRDVKPPSATDKVIPAQRIMFGEDDGACLCLRRHLDAVRPPLSLKTGTANWVQSPGRVSTGFSHVGIVLDDAAGSADFLWDLPFPPAHTPSHFTLTGSQDLDANSRLARKHLANPINARWEPTANEHSRGSSMQKTEDSKLRCALKYLRAETSGPTQRVRKGEKALLEFYFQGFPPPHAKKALSSLDNYTEGTTHRPLWPSGSATRLTPRRTGFNPWPDHSRVFARGNRAGPRRWSEGFLGDLQFPPPLHSGAAAAQSSPRHYDRSENLQIMYSDNETSPISPLSTARIKICIVRITWNRRLTHTQDDSAPIADFQGNKRRIPYCQMWGNTGATANEQTSETPQSTVYSRASDVCTLAAAPVTPHTWQYGIRFLFPCKSAIGSDSSRKCIINSYPIAKRGIAVNIRVSLGNGLVSDWLTTSCVRYPIVWVASWRVSYQSLNGGWFSDMLRLFTDKPMRVKREENGCRAGETGDPRENQLTSGIVVREFRGDPAGNRTRSPLAGGEYYTIVAPVCSQMLKFSIVYEAYFLGKASFCCSSFHTIRFLHAPASQALYVKRSSNSFAPHNFIPPATPRRPCLSISSLANCFVFASRETASSPHVQARQEARERYGRHQHARLVSHRSYAQGVQCFRRDAVLCNSDM